MASRRGSRNPAPERGPTVPPNRGRDLLAAQVEKARALIAQGNVDEDTFEVWNSATTKIMKAAFGEGEHIVYEVRDAGELNYIRAADEELPEGHYRRRLEKAIPRIEGAMSQLELGIAPAPAVAAPVAATHGPSRLTINIHAPVGNLNTGHLTGDLNAQMTVLMSQGHEAVAKALKELSEAVLNHSKLSDGERESDTESLTFLAEQAATEPARRKGTLVRAALHRLKEALSVAADLVTLGQAFGPTIASLFGLRF
jgi:hypothetical protein